MPDIFIGRQPIFDHELKVYAYELLFRSQEDQVNAVVVDGDSATSRVMLNTIADIGLNKLVGKHLAFINLTRYFLEDPERIIFAPGQIVLEVLEDIEAENTIVKTLARLKELGHTIALDDFIYSEELQPLVNLADIIKMDIMAMSRDEIERQVKLYKRFKIRLLAEKVETYEEFEFLKQLGFDYYQGYFFSKPTVIKGKGLESNQLSIMRLIGKVSNPELEVSELSELISTDVSLSHKILKFINSPASGLRVEVESVQRAVVLMGKNTIKNWVTMVAMASASDKPHELSTLALVRARSCEQLAKASQQDKIDSFFTIGLFSTLDAMIDQPLADLIQDLPLSDDMKAALIGREGVYGQALNCVEAMEKNDVSKIQFLDLGLPEMSELYLNAIFWSDQQARLLSE